MRVGLETGSHRKVVGRELADLCKAAGYETHQEAADAIGVARITVARWATGKTKPEEAVMPNIARALKEVIGEYDLYLLVGHPPPSDVRSSDDVTEWVRIYEQTPPSKRHGLFRATRAVADTLAGAT
jgi:transcriptional regulator with XRE-family HTH domain